MKSRYMPVYYEMESFSLNEALRAAVKRNCGVQLKVLRKLRRGMSQCLF